MRRFNYQALGRLKKGEMNKCERAYSERLERMKQMGEILDWKFEAVTLKLADACRYTPDFLVINSQCEVSFHEVKGSKFIFQDDAKVKIKVAADKFNMFTFKVCIPTKGVWEITEIGA